MPRLAVFERSRADSRASPENRPATARTSERVPGIGTQGYIGGSEQLCERGVVLLSADEGRRALEQVGRVGLE